jgi:hypothetical protein
MTNMIECMDGNCCKKVKKFQEIWRQLASSYG